MLDDNKLYYTIGEVSDMLDASTSQLRYWSGEFKLNVRKNRKGDRLFQKKDLDVLKTIKRLLKEDGYTIDGARNKLSELKKSDNLEDIESEGFDESLTDTYGIDDETKSSLINKLTTVKNNLEGLKIQIDQIA